jgi:hypothetical protein
MSFRKLRIAWSVLCGIACLLLIVLWVRSYWWIDYVLRVSPTMVSEYCTYDGQIVYSWSDDTRIAAGCMSSRGEGWHLSGQTIESWHRISTPSPGQRLIRVFSLKSNEFVTPIWAPVIVSSTSGVLPWRRQLRWRFGLRTLLIATTLIAVMLGLAVYTARG